MFCGLRWLHTIVKHHLYYGPQIWARSDGATARKRSKKLYNYPRSRSQSSDTGFGHFFGSSPPFGLTRQRVRWFWVVLSIAIHQYDYKTQFVLRSGNLSEIWWCSSAITSPSRYIQGHVPGSQSHVPGSKIKDFVHFFFNVNFLIF